MKFKGVACERELFLRAGGGAGVGEDGDKFFQAIGVSVVQGGLAVVVGGVDLGTGGDEKLHTV